MNACLFRNRREKPLFVKFTNPTLVSTIANAGQDVIIFGPLWIETLKYMSNNVISAQNIWLLNPNNTKADNLGNSKGYPKIPFMQTSW